ncbi:MAG: zinc ribbon domain-containing protein [Vicinamibacterales bacterium]|nr:zinc ribbon domain-containing protein [Vicinamibacterales bacterium]
MSSGTSTEVRLQPDRTDDSLEPWQFFLFAALLVSTGVLVYNFFGSGGQSRSSIILFSVLMGTVCLVGIAALRAVGPLVSPEEDRTAMVGERTRAALEREKLLTLRSIKELEFDRAMGKLSDADWKEMSGRLRARAAGLMKQLDAGSGYREQIERDLAKRLGEPPATTSTRGNFCTQCGTKSEGDARFCRNCGHKL